ncbi:hypothetical protein COCSUDRAFT_83547 [Coccomyxa subellipsoidea C-169]|uniref:ARM repeat-containing protein n=1 Tax=Coccomyxa subellipsoidea (strain C-169) TaxID=574566 RepID=I0YPM8_COCSC|nr:hypothetical protein COCSUDRAFT_83547 [Coccomyxa subellipsoidea C-169]EIE20347.1 hypothetical protein COCSUDRAFT_83547 [Coccomyxa subellipsoidea C-169]|eukprot:XP_005644891.1 hypothetical protein COCSUDRAFT_83547 [Coccomyxa subellipsoidea C-169]
MLSPADSPAAIAAAAAIGQLASANNKAFQIGVGEAGGLTKLLGMARSDNPKAAAAAAKALGGVVMRSRVMQESLLDAGGVEALVQLLASFPTTTTEAGAGKTGQQEHADCEDSAERLGPSRSGPDTKIQLLRVSLNAQDSWEKQAAAAAALTSFVQGFAPGPEEVARFRGIPKLVDLLCSSSETVKERAAEALLAVVGKDAGSQAALRESGGVPSVLSLIQSSTGAGHSRAAEHAAALLYRLTFYQAAHAELQAAGCIEALVPLLHSGEARLKRHAVWAVQNLTEQPDQATLLEPAAIALSNLAAGTEAHKERIVDAGALPVLVKLLSHQEEAAGALGSLVRGHTANQEAVRAAGAIARLISLVTTSAPAVRGQAAWALQALTEGNAACQEDFRQSGGVASLTGLLRFPEQWNWTPAVGAADTLGSMAATSREAEMAIHEAGGTDKLKELCSAASAAPAAVKKAAGRCLANMGLQRQQRSKDPVLIRAATKVLNFKLRLMRLKQIPE